MKERQLPFQLCLSFCPAKSDFLPKLNGSGFKAHQKAAEIVLDVAVLVEQRTYCSFSWVQKRNQEVVV